MFVPVIQVNLCVCTTDGMKIMEETAVIRKSVVFSVITPVLWC